MAPDTILKLADCEWKKLPLGALEAFVLSQIDGQVTLEEIAEITGLDFDAAAKMAERLVELGAVSAAKKVARAEKISVRRDPVRSEPVRSELARSEPARANAIKAQETVQGPPPRRKSRRSVKAMNAVVARPAQAEVASDVCELDDETQAAIATFDAKLGTLDCYAILDVDRGADKKAIKRAYFALASKYHPDRYFGKKIGRARVAVERIFHRITEAHDTLTDRDRRTAYDATLPPAPKPAAPPRKSSRKMSRALKAASAQIAAVVPAPAPVKAPVSAPVQIAAVAPPPTPAAAPTQPIVTPVSPPTTQPIVTPVSSPPKRPIAAWGSSPPTRPNITPVSLPPTQPKAAPPASAPAPMPPRSLVPSSASASAPAPMPARSLVPSSASAPAPPRSLAPSPSPSAPASPPPGVAASPTASQGRRAFDLEKQRETQRRVEVFVQAAEQALKVDDVIGATNNYRLALQNADDPLIRLKLEGLEELAKTRRHELSVTRARAAEREQRWADAALNFSKAHEARPDAAIAERAAYALRMSDGDLHRAAAMAEYAVSVDGKNAAYRVTLGEIYFAANLLKRAATEAERAVELAPSDPRAMDLAALLKKKK